MSINARDRFLPDWFERIRTRQLTLPRFQRFEAWSHAEVAGLLTTVMRGLPSGAALILEVGGSEKFQSRTMAGAPTAGERVTEQLLDGQQRLTALWRALQDDYPDRTYLVTHEPDQNHPEQMVPVVAGVARYQRDGLRYPLWVDRPTECWKRKMTPIRLLRPGDLKTEIDAWTQEATSGLPSEVERFRAIRAMDAEINDLRTRVREFNLPFLALPHTTEKDVALDVFVKMNTSSVQLSAYDIVVALVEGETGRSLHDHVRELEGKAPRATAYTDLPGLLLDVLALRQDRVPSNAGYQGLDFKRLLDPIDWSKTVHGIQGMVEFLEEEAVYDAARLPSYTPLPVLAAVWEFLPTQPDRLGNARILLRKYLWRAFLTSRYEQSSASNSLQDFRGLRGALCQVAGVAEAPIFNEDLYGLPSEEEIVHAGWPIKKGILERGLMAIQLRCGALDLADGRAASVAAFSSPKYKREYHHLFPASRLEAAGIREEHIYRAVNCALITWRTNRTLAAKTPLSYLQERAEASALGRDELLRRLATHLIPFEELSVDPGPPEDPESPGKWNGALEVFCKRRAGLLAEAAKQLSNGVVPNPQELCTPITRT